MQLQPWWFRSARQMTQPYESWPPGSLTKQWRTQDRQNKYHLIWRWYSSTLDDVHSLGTLHHWKPEHNQTEIMWHLYIINFVSMHGKVYTKSEHWVPCPVCTEYRYNRKWFYHKDHRIWMTNEGSLLSWENIYFWITKLGIVQGTFRQCLSLCKLATASLTPKILGSFWWILALKYVLIDMWANDQNGMMFSYFQQHPIHVEILCMFCILSLMTLISFLYYEMKLVKFWF